VPAYIVIRPEVHVQHLVVEAATPEEALTIVLEGGGHETGEVEYWYTPDPDDVGWEVAEADS